MIALSDKKIHPLVVMASCLNISIVGLVTAKSPVCTIFAGAVFLWLVIFGYAKYCIMVLPAFVLMAGTFFLINYAISGSMELGFDMANRFLVICIAIVPGIELSPARMTRSLSSVHAPRAVTLGMLIAMTFTPKLKEEVHRVREAMRTRGAGSLLSPVTFYRALVVPFIMRLVGISDTLALSVDTRGFSMAKGAKYTIYKRERVGMRDIIFMLGLIALVVLALLGHIYRVME